MNMNGTDLILVKLLALRNVMFTPMRSFAFNRNANACTGRIQYGQNGIPWSSDEKAAAGRMRAHRELEEAVEAGLVIPIRAGTRTIGVKLTSAGELRAAGRCGQFAPGDAEAREVLAAMLRRMCTVPEDDLRELRGIAALRKIDRPRALVLIQEALLPFIVRGFIGAGSSVRGNVRYWLASPLPSDFDFGPPVDAIFTEEAHNHYVDAFNAEWDRLASVPVSGGEIGPIPLPVSAASQAELDGWRMSAELAKQGK